MKRTVSICIFCLMILVFAVIIVATTRNNPIEITPQEIENIDTIEKNQSIEMETITDSIKTNKIEEPYDYILMEKDGHLQVFYSDNMTLFFDSGIQTKNLTKDQYDKIKNGIRFNNVDDLYEFLENYSS